MHTYIYTRTCVPNFLILMLYIDFTFETLEGDDVQKKGLWPYGNYSEYYVPRRRISLAVDGYKHDVEPVQVLYMYNDTPLFDQSY